jgi:hypothetical protein
MIVIYAKIVACDGVSVPPLKRSSEISFRVALRVLFAQTRDDKTTLLDSIEKLSIKQFASHRRGAEKSPTVTFIDVLHQHLAFECFLFRPFLRLRRSDSRL